MYFSTTTSLSSQIDKVDDLGNLGMTTLITDCDIAPKILPCRKIPIALQQGVKTELDTLVKRGILVPNGKMAICDYA